MIAYPRIHSLNTVSLLKHYHQCYLLHPVRTDFTGRNGIGKSIIADLFQLIFIGDKNSITFGTEGLNPKERKIEKLPYKSRYGYAFLNIEIEENEFITLGVCIHNNKAIPLELFVIIKGKDLNKDIDELTMERRFCYTDFINSQNNIRDLTQLARYIKGDSNNTLSLKSFRKKEKRKIYYNWLEKKQILPINLSIKENLDAFGKVIQSFSKVKDLKLNESKSLKKFLFDDSLKSNIKKYNSLKKDLDELLHNFNSLDTFIKTTKEKQKDLKELKKRKINKNNFQYDYLTSSLIYVTNQLEKIKDSYKKDYNDILEKKAILQETRKDKAKKDDKYEIVSKKYKETDSNLISLLQYQIHYENFKRLEKEIATQSKEILKQEKLINKEAPKLNNIKQDIVDITKVQIPEKNNSIEQVSDKKIKSDALVEELNSAVAFYKKYGNLEGIKLKYEEQNKVLNSKLEELNATKKRLQEVKKLLEKTSKDTFFQWAIEEQKPLTLYQETVLFHLKDTLLRKPVKPKALNRFAIDMNKLLWENDYEADTENNGLWVNLGYLKEFIHIRKEKRLFANPETLATAIQNEIGNIINNIKTITLELAELQKIKDGEPYCQKIIDYYVFDEKIIHYQVIKRLEKVSLFFEEEELYQEEILKNKKIEKKYKKFNEELGVLKAKKDSLLAEQLNLKAAIDTANGKIAKLETEKDSLIIQKTGVETKKAACKDKITIPIQHKKLVAQIKTLDNQKSDLDNQKGILLEEVSNLNLKLTGLQTKIQALSKNINNILKPILKNQCKEYQKAKQLYCKSYPNEEYPNSIESITQEDVSNKKSEYDESLGRYRSYYEELSQSKKYDETRKNDDIRIKLQIEKQSYKFDVLEQTLLGSKINYKDGIGVELDRANQNRKKIAEQIHQKMYDVFTSTKEQYQKYHKIIKDLNIFFKGKDTKINRLSFKIEFKPRQKFNQNLIDWIDILNDSSQRAYKVGEIRFGESVEEFVMNFYKEITSVDKVSNVMELLNPKNYFDLKAMLLDEEGNEISGSTGESYSAILLLGIARLSKVQNTDSKGIRFLILEEVASLDSENFNKFPNLAEKFGYQLITMTPKPYDSLSDSEWYLHCIFEGIGDKNMNYPTPASFFRTNTEDIDLEEYLNSMK